jgi:thioredoxin-dependent peroxiredoxin
MTQRRYGVIREADEPVTLIGPELRVGQPAPPFTCVRWDNELDQLVTVTLADTPARVRLFSVAPSLDTDVCDTQTRRFNDAVAVFGDSVAAYSVSVDTPAAIGRFCTTAGITNLTGLSDYRPSRSFGTAWGLLIDETGELARAVVILDTAGVVRYLDLVADTWHHADYAAALVALESIVTGA